MKIETRVPTSRTRPLGMLNGGECFRLVPGGAIYLRLTGASSRLGVPTDKKIGITIGSGVISVQSADKLVYPVTMIAREIEEDR